MSRLPELDPAKFSPEQKKVHEAVLAGPRGRVVGPIKVWLKNPGLAEHAQALGAYARFNSSLPPRLSELAICVTGAFWKANFEWYAHAPMAINAGIDPAAIEAIRTGATLKLTKSDEQAVYDFAIEIITKRRVFNSSVAKSWTACSSDFTSFGVLPTRIASTAAESIPALMASGACANHSKFAFQNAPVMQIASSESRGGRLELKRA